MRPSDREESQSRGDRESAVAQSDTLTPLDAVTDRSGDERIFGDAMADEVTPDPAGVAQGRDVEQLVAGWIDALPQREREVLEGHFGLHDREPETLEVLSARVGLTRERVRQIQNEALIKLKKSIHGPCSVSVLPKAKSVATTGSRCRPFDRARAVRKVVVVRIRTRKAARHRLRGIPVARLLQLHHFFR
jgi:hypothetical protein